MRPRLLPALALAGTLVAALTLNGCQGNTQNGGTIAGAGSGSVSPSVSTAPSVSAAPVAGLDLSFSIPADLRLEFQTVAQASVTANQIQTILVDQYEAYIEALSSAGGREANYRLLTLSGALAAENSELTWWKQHGERVTGTDRLYDFTVGKISKDLVAFSYCEDSTQLQYKDLEGGRTIPNNAGNAANHTLRTGQVAKGKGELWAVTTLLTQNGAQQCMQG